MIETLETVYRDNQVLVAWIGIVSVGLFFGCLTVVPWLVVRIPSDYFISSQRSKSWGASRHPLFRTLFVIGKNLVGGILVLAGVAMLVLPGQGILTIVIGLLMLDFPRKYQLERWVIRFGAVHRSINWVRRNRGVDPILIE